MIANLQIVRLDIFETHKHTARNMQLGAFDVPIINYMMFRIILFNFRP